MKLFFLALVGFAATLAVGQPAPKIESGDETDDTHWDGTHWREARRVEARQGYIGQACTNTAHNNIFGTCQYTSTCGNRNGIADVNPDCPGPDNVQCCILDNCVNGASGVCLDTRQWNCQGGGGFNSGNHCPGPDSYLCCQGSFWRKGGPRPEEN